MNKEKLANLLLNKYGQTLENVKVKGVEVAVAMVRNGYNPWLMFYLNRQDDPHTLADTDGELAIKCGPLSSMLLKVPVFFKPSLTDNDGWVGIIMSAKNERTITDLISTAWRTQGSGPKPVKYLHVGADEDDDGYQPEFIKQRPEKVNRDDVVLPQRLREMKESYNWQLPLAQQVEVNFYRQGQMVSDYEDDYDGFAELHRLKPAYHGLTNAQLRTYFALRTKWRANDFPKQRPGMNGYLTLYKSELVNGIGCESPVEAFDRLKVFLTHYQDASKLFDQPENILKQMVLYYGLDQKRSGVAFKQELANDKLFHTLLNPDQYSAQELLAIFGEKTYQNCQLYKKDPQRFMAIFKLIWQRLLEQKAASGYDFIGDYLSDMGEVRGGEFFKGLVFEDRIHEERTYHLDSLRSYHINGRYFQSNEIAAFLPRKGAIKALFREIDRATRIAFHIGRSLKAKEVDAAIKTAIKQGLADYQQQLKEARLNKVPIHLADLDQIRDDAAVTQEQLLTDEEVDDPEEPVSQPEATPVAPEDQTVTPKEPVGQPDAAPNPPEDDLPDLTDAEWFFLKALVNHQPYQEYLKKHFLMASLVADAVNEKLMDEIGDTVIEFNDDDQPEIIDYYLDDVKRLLSEKED